MLEKIRCAKMQKKYFVLIIILCHLFNEVTAPAAAAVVAVAGLVGPPAQRAGKAALNQASSDIRKGKSASQAVANGLNA